MYVHYVHVRGLGNAPLNSICTHCTEWTLNLPCQSGGMNSRCDLEVGGLVIAARCVPHAQHRQQRDPTRLRDAVQDYTRYVRKSSCVSCCVTVSSTRELSDAANTYILRRMGYLGSSRFRLPCAWG